MRLVKDSCVVGSLQRLELFLGPECLMLDVAAPREVELPDVTQVLAYIRKSIMLLDLLELLLLERLLPVLEAQLRELRHRELVLLKLVVERLL